MLKVVNSKLHHYSKKEKSTFRRNSSWAVLEEPDRSKRYKDLGVTEKKGNWLQMEMEDMIMAAQDQALRTNTIKTIDKQNVPAKCRMAEKVMRQLAIWYRYANNLPKSNIDVVGKTRWCR